MKRHSRISFAAGFAVLIWLAGPADAALFGIAPGGAIADGPPGCDSLLGTATAFQSITIAPGTILSINHFLFHINGLTHTWQGDLTIILHGPAGSYILLDQLGSLSDASCGSANDFINANLTFQNGGAAMSPGLITGTPQAFAPQDNPNTSITGLTQLPVAGDIIGGTWTLEIHDHAGSDIGSFSSWGLSGPLGPAPGVLPVFLAGLLASRRRR